MTSDKRRFFGTDGIRGRFGDRVINPEFMLKLGWAIGRVFSGTKHHSKILIGKDTRISGYVIESALEAGLVSAGANVRLLGPMPTPAIAYLTQTFRANAGIVISASHNPYYDNGVKFFGADGKKLSDKLEIRIEEELEETMTVVDSKALGKAARINDAPGRYIEFCKATAPSLSLQGMKIVVDCANGATYHIAPSVFKELGAEVIELAVDPDGTNINENCGATNLTSLQRIVLAENADLGVALDGDGDRVMMVDHKGEIVDGDELLYIIVTHAKAQDVFAGGVVGTVMTNLGIEKAFADRGIEFARASVGDRYVMSELVKRGWSFGGEGSGHVVCLNKTTTGDGIVTALQVLSALRLSEKTLHDLHAGIEKYPQLLVNVKVSQKVDPMSIPAIKAAVQATEKRFGKRGRVLLRASGTEPLIRIMVEGENESEVTAEAEQLAEIVRRVI